MDRIDYRAKFLKASRDVDRLLSRLQRVEAAGRGLRPYVHHLAHCPWLGYTPGSCTCGLSDKLAAFDRALEDGDE